MLTVEQIRQTVTAYFKDKPVKRVWLFGSYARGEADDKSDVDLLVDIDYTGRIGWGFFAWPDELKELFGTPKVDVITTGGLSKHLAPYILADQKLIYEEG